MQGNLAEIWDDHRQCEAEWIAMRRDDTAPIPEVTEVQRPLVAGVPIVIKIGGQWYSCVVVG